MTDDRAREEAERRWPSMHTNPSDGLIAGGFIQGAAWQAAQPVVVSAEQVEDLRQEISRLRSRIPQRELYAYDRDRAALGITVGRTP